MRGELSPFTEADGAVTAYVAIQTVATEEVRLADDGTGIPESKREILETGKEIDPPYHGTGLGLWLFYWLVRRSGGSLSFSENVPEGSKTTIALTRQRAVGSTCYVTEQ